MARMMSASEISPPPGQPEAAVRTALAADQPGAPELGQDRLKELTGDHLRPGKLVSRHVTAAGGGQFDDGPQRVVGASGQTHMDHYAGNRGWRGRGAPVNGPAQSG